MLTESAWRHISALNLAVWESSPLEIIDFKDDPFLRFVRVPLRFGKPDEKTILDMGFTHQP